MNYLMVDSNLETLCRICLTHSKNMIQLVTPLNAKEIDGPLVIEALEKVMSVKIICDHRYPKVICPMCLGLLKISYNLNLQFLSSQNVLQEHFKEPLLPLSLADIKENVEIIHEESSKPSPVEIIVGPNKYDLKDVIIVEEEKENQDNFKGFLSNLGKTVTANFVNKLDKCTPKNVQEEPVVLIEKIKPTANNVNTNKNKVRKAVTKVALENIDQYIITQDDEFNKINDQTILKENLNLEEYGLENPTDVDQELFQSALNMQLKCDNCQKLYSSKGRFKKHLGICGRLQYQIIDDEKGQPTITFSPLVLKCHICSRSFKQRKFLNYHIKTAHNIEPSKYTCEICGQVSRNRNAFMYHKLTKHGERKFNCNICGKRFFTSSSLKTHNQNHTQRDIAQCVCHVCGKTFHYKGGLFYHMKQHTNERKYCCEFCDKRFYTLMAKKRHALTHTGIRPYACKFCEKKFFSTGEVRKHEYLHTGFRPYRCQYCKKGFSSEYNMKVHLVSHPGSFVCKICDRSFVTSAVLQFHQKIKHGIIKENNSNRLITSE